MSEKKILLMTVAKRGEEFGQRLKTALEGLGCQVEECDATDAVRILALLNEDRIPVVLK